MRITSNQYSWKPYVHELKFNGMCFVGAKYHPAKSAKVYAAISPIDGHTLVQIAECDAADVDYAVRCARDAVARSGWNALSVAARKEVLFELANLIEDNQEEFALLESLQTGKPVRTTLERSVANAVEWLQFSAECLDKIVQTSLYQADVLVANSRAPVGVVGVILAAHFPLENICRAIGPILATGNAVIVKPAKKATLCAIRLGQIANAAGIPAGIYNVLSGGGEAAGGALAAHVGLDALAFHGQHATALLAQQAASGNGTIFAYQPPAATVHVVCQDVTDIDYAAKQARDAMLYFQNTDQVDCALVCVDTAIAAELQSKLLQLTAAFKVGHSLEKASDIGAVISAQQVDGLQQLLQRKIAAGAEVLCGGVLIECEQGGWYVTPTVVLESKDSLACRPENVYVPLLSVLVFDDARQLAELCKHVLPIRNISVHSRQPHPVMRYLQTVSARSIMIHNGVGGNKSLELFVVQEQIQADCLQFTTPHTTWIQI